MQLEKAVLADRAGTRPGGILAIEERTDHVYEFASWPHPMPGQLVTTWLPDQLDQGWTHIVSVDMVDQAGRVRGDELAFKLNVALGETRKHHKIVLDRFRVPEPGRYRFRLRYEGTRQPMAEVSFDARPRTVHAITSAFAGR